MWASDLFDMALARARRPLNEIRKLTANRRCSLLKSKTKTKQKKTTEKYQNYQFLRSQSLNFLFIGKNHHNIFNWIHEGFYRLKKNMWEPQQPHMKLQTGRVKGTVWCFQKNNTRQLSEARRRSFLSGNAWRRRSPPSGQKTTITQPFFAQIKQDVTC